jgi:cell division protein FtsQ
LPWRKIGRIAAAVGGVSAALFIGWWLWSGSTFRVNTVVVLGTEIVDPNEVVAAANVQGDSMFTLDTGGIEKRIEALPGVRSVSVQRDLPRGVEIQVQEQQAWGFWQAAGIRAVIDAEGHVLAKARPPAANAPTIYEAGGAPLQPGGSADRDTVILVTRLLSDGTFQRLGVTPQRFEFDRANGLTVRVDGGPSAVFGDSHDYEFKVAAWAALLDRIKTQQISAGEVDLRFGRELVVR